MRGLGNSGSTIWAHGGNTPRFQRIKMGLGCGEVTDTCTHVSQVLPISAGSQRKHPEKEHTFQEEVIVDNRAQVPSRL